MTPRRILALTSVAACVGLVLPVATAGAGAGSSIDVTATATLDRDVASFDLEYVESGQGNCLDTPTGEAFEEGTENAVDATFSLADGGGLVSFGDAVPAGYYDVVLTCDIGEGTIVSGNTSVAFARGYVVKEVVGDAPASAAFVIDVDCVGEDEGQPTAAAPFSLTFEYASDGGREGFVVYAAQDCTVTETDDGGAIESAVEGTFAFPEPVAETVTVTNTFANAVTPPTPPGPGAQPVVAAPSFTG